MSPIQQIEMGEYSVEFRRIQLYYGGLTYAEDMDDVMSTDGMAIDDYLVKQCLREELHECINQHQPSLLLFGTNTNSYGVFLKEITVINSDTHILSFFCGTNRVEPSWPYPKIGGFHCSVIVRKQ